MTQQSNQFKPRKNFQIRASQVRLINSDGSNLGVVPIQEAIKLAQEQGLDLIEINYKSSPVVVKIADYGKMLYEEKKKQSEIRKNQKIQELKEITFRPNTDENDLKHKLEAAKSFLNDGHKVKFTIRFRGREVTHPEVAKEKIDWIIEQLGTLILSPAPISMEGKFMFLIVNPAKK